MFLRSELIFFKRIDYHFYVSGLERSHWQSVLVLTWSLSLNFCFNAHEVIEAKLSKGRKEWMDFVVVVTSVKGLNTQKRLEARRKWWGPCTGVWTPEPLLKKGSLEGMLPRQWVHGCIEKLLDPWKLPRNSTRSERQP